MLNPEHQFLLPLVTVLSARLHNAFGKVVGLHLSRFRVLFLLYVAGEATPTYLMRQTAGDAAALTRVLKDFEEQGLVLRRPDPDDARQTLLRLSEKGLEAVRDYLPRRDAFVAEALDGLDSEELATLARLMERVEANLSALAGLPPIGLTMNVDPERPPDI
jgi:DNA-binding MarR family transcriptional regulator